MFISGYTASFFYCLGLKYEKARAFMKTTIFVLFVVYVIMLADFTLIDDNFGRNIFNFLSWDKTAFLNYLNESTNVIPFVTVKLFIRGYLEDNLTFKDTIINLLGNFAILMPLTFFVSIFFEKINSIKSMILTVMGCSVCIEILQLLFLTGATDVDDVILNTLGAICFYRILRIKSVKNLFSKLTFGVYV